MFAILLANIFSSVSDVVTLFYTVAGMPWSCDAKLFFDGSFDED